MVAPNNFGEDVSVDDIEAWTQEIKDGLMNAIVEIEEKSDSSSSSSCSSSSWEDTVGALSRALGKSAEASAKVTLPSMTHADALVRKASIQSKDDLKFFFDQTFARPTLYQALFCRDCDDDDASSSPLPSTSTTTTNVYLDHVMKQHFRRNGAHLPNEETRRMLLEKRQELERICSDFTSSINEHSDDTLELTEEELDGVDDLSNFPVSKTNNNNKRVVTFKAPFIKPIMQFATHAATRQTVATAMAQKCQTENTSRFLQALRIRQECAELLGYPSHAHYMLESKMASNPQRAEQFLCDLIDKLKPTCQHDIAILQQLKQQDNNNNNNNNNSDDDEGIQVWDTAYYQRMYKAKTLGVDEAKLKTYFPLDHVKQQILSMYEELLHLKFIKQQDAQVWHPDVECYAVTSATNNNNNNNADDDHPEEVLGYFYFDIFPRNGKYSHQCVYPLRPGYMNSEGEHVKPACVNIGNLNPSQKNDDGGEQPSFLLFSEVVTFFHEFGHVMHCVLSQSKHSLQAWAWSAVPWPGGVEQDFLEVPSMMLENFVWQPDVLRRLSHHTNDGSQLPEEDISALCKSRFVMEGYNRSRYLAMALYDLKVHSPTTTQDGLYEYKGEVYDAIALYDAMMTDISGISQIPESFPVASWFHPMMGYDAGYYSYIWSETYAADLFREFEETFDDDDGDTTTILNPALGQKYKECILNPCATMDGNSMLRSFLGREPSNQAFLNRMMNTT